MSECILGLIPARGGSRGIPRKNMASLGGRPLIQYTFDVAAEAECLDRVVLSTDDEEIATYSRSKGVEAPFLRPATLAADSTPMIDVTLHALHELAASGFSPEIVVVLQPTSPFRTAGDIRTALRLLRTSDADTVVSVVHVPHQYSPVSIMRRLSDGTVVPFLEGPVCLRRQDKPVLFARNGPAVLAVRARVVHEGRLYGDRVMPLEMPLDRSIDIDTPDDLLLAEYMLQQIMPRGRQCSETE